MSIPVLYVDFNQMIKPNIVLLSKEDYKPDIKNELVYFKEGMRVTVIDEDLDENGNIDNLVATGIVEINTTKGWGERIKWCCRIDSNGIRHQSECSNP
jgi:hypothetical protein